MFCTFFRMSLFNVDDFTVIGFKILLVLFGDGNIGVNLVSFLNQFFCPYGFRIFVGFFCMNE